MKCTKILTDMYKDIETQVEQGNFTRPGGHASFRDLIVKFENNYGQIAESVKGPCGQRAILKFRSEKVIIYCNC